MKDSNNETVAKIELLSALLKKIKWVYLTNLVEPVLSESSMLNWTQTIISHEVTLQKELHLMTLHQSRLTSLQMSGENWNKCFC
jgi:hypothetical protein